MFNKLPMYQNVGESAYKKDLSNIILICDHLNNPQNNFKSIHVGGTNGKGSCSHMLSSILQEAGYNVGLYTSPHLVDFRERVRINGDMISKDSVSKFMHVNFDFFESNNLSFFEMTVGLAFDYFSKNKVDIAIIEVGMGGRLDSTNIINPILSVITNISLDHTKFLGTSITDIAQEKAGIIKENTPVVVGETQNETKPIFINTAKSKSSEIVFADQFNYENFDCDLKGNYQKKNIKTVLKSVEFIQNTSFKISQEHIKNGLESIFKNTGLMGRWQIISNNPIIICDTAHNEAAIRMVVSQLIRLDYLNLHFIIGFSNDKNLEKISKLFPKDSKYYFVQSKVGRARNAREVRDIFKLNNRHGDIFESIKTTIEYVKGLSNENDVIFIGGSTFVVSEIFDKN